MFLLVIELSFLSSLHMAEHKNDLSFIFIVHLYGPPFPFSIDSRWTEQGKIIYTVSAEQGIPLKSVIQPFQCQDMIYVLGLYPPMASTAQLMSVPKNHGE